MTPSRPGSLAHATVAFLSMEIAVETGMHSYSGGLGVLAGDYALAAADLGLPIVFISMVCREGYVRQEIDADGWQHHEKDPWDPAEWATALPVVPTVTIEGRQVRIRSWLRELVGAGSRKVPVLFLDTDVEENDPDDRGITGRLYGGDLRTRLRQEAVLGLGGKAVLDALGLGKDKKPEQPPGAAADEVVFEAEGERHRLFYEGDPATSEPMINPTPKQLVATELTDLEAKIKTDLPIPKDQKAAQAEVDAARTLLGKKGTPLTSLKPHLAALYSKLGHPDVPESVVAGHDGGIGTHTVTADPLTRKAGNTKGESAPKPHPNAARDITLLNTKAGLSAKGYKSIEWVAAHLLSARLHGPSTEGNLTPASQVDNKKMLTKVEAPAIKLLAANEGRNMLWWNAQLTQSTDPTLPHWASKLVVTYGEWDPAAGPNGGRGKQLGQADVTPSPNFTGARSIGSLSEDGAIRLKAVTGMNISVANAIVATREVHGRFDSIYQVADRYDKTLFTKGGGRTTLDPMKVAAELERLHTRLVPYFGFDPDADNNRYLAYLAERYG